MYNYRNPKYTDDGGIECEVEHPKYGWIPHLVHDHDNKELFDKIVSDNAVKTYEAPTLSSDPNDYPLSRMQFHAMVDIIGKRSSIQQAINNMGTAKEKAVANAKLNHSNKFLRNDELVIGLSAAVGMTPEELDEAWLDAKDLV